MHRRTAAPTPWRTPDVALTGAHGLTAVAWVLAAVWTVRVVPAVVCLRRVPDLNRLPEDCQPASLPTITVVVAAKDEGSAIEATLRSLAAQDYAHLQVVAVDDRSTDGTGAMMEGVARQFPDRVRVLHLETLPPGWAGKVHAMTQGAAACTSDYLLFTDGDIFFAPQALRRALTCAVATRADHFVCMPTLRVRRWDEGMILATITIASSLAVRLWKVPDPRAKRDAVGVGAFNMVRRSAFERLGGFARRPLEIVEDLRLAQDMKAAGFRSIAAFGKDLVQVHWAAGLLGIVRTLTKNAFAALGFRLSLVCLAAAFTLAMFLVPVVGVFVPGMRGAAVLTLAMMGVASNLSGRQSGVSAWYGLLSPIGAVGVAGALLFSAATTLRQGGVQWRGTFYPLAALRRQR